MQEPDRPATAITETLQKSAKFDELTDIRTVLDNFLSHPLQFKFNKDQTRIFVMSQEKITARNVIQTKIMLYSLPEFNLIETSLLHDIDLRTFGQCSGFKYLDVSEDEIFILYGHEGKLIIQSTNSLFPAAYPTVVNTPFLTRDLSLPQLAFPSTCGARFTENNQVAFVYFFEKDKQRQIIVKQTRSQAVDILNGVAPNDSMSTSIIEGEKPDEFLIHQAIDVRIPYKEQQNSYFNIILFNSCFYIRFQDSLYIYRYEISSQQLSENQEKNKQDKTTSFWDPIKSQQVLTYNKKDQVKKNPFQTSLQSKEQEQDPFSNIVQCFVQDGILLVQNNQGLIFMYQQQLGIILGRINEMKKLNLEQFYSKSEEMIAFKLYQGNLYFKNDSISKLDVLSFRDGSFKKLWSYQYDQNYMIDSHYQFQTSHYIQIHEKEQQKVLRQINGYTNELLFKQIWPYVRPQFTMIADDQLFQDVQDNGCLYIIDKNGRQFVKQVSAKDSKLSFNVWSFRNIIKNIYYSEELAQLVLIKQNEISANLKQQIFLMSTEGPEYEVRELSEEILNQNFSIIGTMFKNKTNQDVVLLFCLVDSQNLVVFELENKSKDRKKLFEIKKIYDRDYKIISDYECTIEEDIFILKESKLLIVKIYDTHEYQIFYDFSEDSKGQNKIKDNGILFGVSRNRIYFLNQNQIEKKLYYYDINPELKKFEGPKAIDPQIKPANFQIMWDAVDKPRSNLRERKIENDRYIFTENFFICQNKSKIFVFDAKTFDQICQIDNVPLDCKFIKTNQKQFYLLIKSSIDGLIDVKRFNLLNDKELLKFNENQLLRNFKYSKAVEAPKGNTKNLVNKQDSDQINDIPNEFQLSLDTFITFDYFESRVELYYFGDGGNFKVWTNMQSRSMISKNLLKIPHKKVILDFFMKKSIENQSPSNFQECLFFDTLHKKSFLHLSINNSQIFTAIIDQLLTIKEDQLPYLMFEDELGRNPLDIAIQNQQFNNVVSLLKLMVYHKSAAQLYNPIIDKHLTALILMELNLKELFESEILYHSISGYQTQENNKSDFLFPTVYDSQDDIYKGYDLIVNDFNSLLLKKAQQDDEEEEPAELGQVRQMKKFSVDYKLIDMKQTLAISKFNSDKPTLMQVLLKQTRKDIFEIPCIQRIIDYKWLTYTKDFFQMQFQWFLAFCLMFYLNLFVQESILEEYLKKETLLIASIDFGEIQLGYTVMTNILLTVGISIIALKFLTHEVKQIFYSNFTDYINDFWNVNDLLLFTLVPIQGFLNVFQIVELQSNQMKILKSLIIVLFFIKLNYFLRIFETFSFLVSMLKNVFSDLSTFLSFFMIVVTIFSCMIQVLIPETKVNYDGTGYFSYLMMAFRTSVGDYSFDDYKAQEMKEITWILWLAIMIIGNVVFMNFIFAVVNDSYSTSMVNKVSMSYRLKVPLIIEREKLFQEQQDFIDIKRKRMNEMEAEANRIRKNVYQNGLNPSEQDNIGKSEMTKMTIFLPSYIVVRTSITAGNSDDGPTIFQNQLQTQIQEIQKIQVEIQRNLGEIQRSQGENLKSQQRSQEEIQKIVGEIKIAQIQQQEELKKVNDIVKEIRENFPEKPVIEEGDMMIL